MRRQKPLPLFEAHGFEGTVQHAVRTRLELTGQADSSADVVRAKERSLAALHRPGSDLDRLRRVLDLWCAAWFWQQGQPPNEGTFAALSAALLHGRHDLPPAVAGPLLDQAGALATQLKFLHWTVTFPEVFADADGRPSVCPGFDAVLGNPPWDMVRGDSGSDTARTAGRNHARRLTSFVRESGIYQVDAGAHLNRYQLFVERTLQLVKPGGRIGLVLPAGAATDAGAAGLRRHLFARTAVDTLTGLDNRGGIFPIHRSVRFVLLTCTTGESTFQVACRFGISVPEQLFHADAGSPLVITTRLLRRISGDEDLGIPEVASSRDLAILEAVAARHPLLGSGDGWHARFGRELNASDDRHRLVPFTGDPDARPVLEGKHVDPFRARLGDCRFQLADDSRVRVPWRPRLVYRDIASATNRLTLIAAVAPARAATTHTLFCLKTPLPLLQQHALAALMNSLVANYLIRMRVNTHVTVALVSRLPVPWRPPDSPVMRRIGELARELARGTGAVERDDRYVELQARSARLYGVRADDLEHVLATFPLIAADVRQAIRSRFEELPTWP